MRRPWNYLIYCIRVRACNAFSRLFSSYNWYTSARSVQIGSPVPFAATWSISLCHYAWSWASSGRNSPSDISFYSFLSSICYTLRKSAWHYHGKSHHIDMPRFIAFPFCGGRRWNCRRTVWCKTLSCRVDDRLIPSGYLWALPSIFICSLCSSRLARACKCASWFLSLPLHFQSQFFPLVLAYTPEDWRSMGITPRLSPWPPALTLFDRGCCSKRSSSLDRFHPLHLCLNR